MLDVYAVLGGPGELSLAFQIIEDSRKTRGRDAVLIVNRACEAFARTYDGISDVVALDVPAADAERCALIEKLAVKMTAGGAEFFAYDTAQLVALSNGRGLALSNPHADAQASSLLGELRSKPFGLALVEEGGITLNDHLCELAWALQRVGVALVAASTGEVADGPFWRSLSGLEAAVIAQLARRSAVAVGASTNNAYLLSSYARVTYLYLAAGSRREEFAQAAAAVPVGPLLDSTTRLPLSPLLCALGEPSRDCVCPDCGATSGGFALTRNARWVVCERCPAVYPTPLAAA